jgi:hypothetical protein
MSTIHIPDPTSYPIARRVKPMSIGKRVTLAAVGTIGVGAALGLAVFEHTGPVLAAPAAAIVAPGSSASLDMHAVGIASPADSQPGTMAVGTAPASAPDSIAVSYSCPTNPPTPTNPWKQGTHPPIHPAALHRCGSDGSISGPDGGGTGDTGQNPGPVDTGNGPGDPNTPPSGQLTGGSGGAPGDCIGDEIECHEPV